MPWAWTRVLAHPCPCSQSLRCWHPGPLLGSEWRVRSPCSGSALTYGAEDSVVHMLCLEHGSSFLGSQTMALFLRLRAEETMQEARMLPGRAPHTGMGRVWGSQRREGACEWLVQPQGLCCRMVVKSREQRVCPGGLRVNDRVIQALWLQGTAGDKPTCSCLAHWSCTHRRELCNHGGRGATTEREVTWFPSKKKISCAWPHSSWPRLWT